MVKNILLDLDDTLLDFKKAEAIAIRDAFVDLGIDPSDENVALYSKINRSCWAKLELGENRQSGVITLTEGKYHQIKRMIASFDNKVTYLRRISFAP